MSNDIVRGESVIHRLIELGIPEQAAITGYNSTDRMHSIEQLTPPAKGAFVRLKTDHLVSALSALHKKLMSIIEARANKNPNYTWLLAYEKFQEGQKGPVSKVDFPRLLESIDTIVDNSSDDICSDIGYNWIKLGAQLLKEQLIHEGLQGSVHLSDINPVVSWLSMKHSSKRGLPWLLKGNQLIDSNGRKTTVDEAIINYYGRSMSKIVDVISNMSGLVGVIGLRLQGKQWPEPAKVRVIYMPEIPEQYGLRAVQYPVQNTIKNKRGQLGYAWAEPADYWTTMAKALAGQNSKYYYLSLDYSKFDTRSSWKIRNLALETLFGVILSDDIPWKNVLIKAIQELNKNQWMLAPDKKSVALYPVNNLLLSGDVMTQLLGNTMNRIYQYAIAASLHYRLPSDLGLCLGDDTALPVPVEIVNSMGYQKLLEHVEKIIGTWGSAMNVKKQFPNIESTIFLQRLYKYDSNIIGEYSIIRATESLVWAERPRQHIQGVKNLDALETVGQLGLLNLICLDQGKTTNKDLLASVIIPWWLNFDPALHALCLQAMDVANDDAQLAGAYILSYLSAAAGGFSAIKEGLGLESYDTYGLLSIGKKKSTLSESLPILSWVASVASKLPRISFDYMNIYKEKTVVGPKLLSKFISELN